MLSKYSKKKFVALQYCPCIRVSYAKLVILLLAVCFISHRTAFAGEINSNEAGVIAAAKGTFYYGGEAYVAKEEYINQLTEELCADDVDLTAGQADEVITEMYGSIKQGIDEGYLKKVSEDSEGKDTEPDTAESTDVKGVEIPNANSIKENENPDKKVKITDIGVENTGKGKKDTDTDKKNVKSGVAAEGKQTGGTEEGSTGGESTDTTPSDDSEQSSVFEADVARTEEIVQETVTTESSVSTEAGGAKASGKGNLPADIVLVVLGGITVVTGCLLLAGCIKKYRRK